MGAAGLGWCHCGLLYLLYYGLLLWIFQGGGALPLGLWRGLLALLPLALADVGAALPQAVAVLPVEFGLCA